MERGPIFIGGTDRSGKSLMRFMLSSHPNLAMTRRTNCWTLFYGQYGDLSRPDNFERCLAAMLKHKHIRILKPDSDRIHQEFWQGEPTYARLFALFHEHYAEREGKSRWGDQTEAIESRADLIFAAYPTAKMIHLIRDPRDRYEAIKSPSRLKRGAGLATAEWLRSVRLAKRNQRHYPQRYKIVRYETMVSQPEQTLREVCAFLDEDYTPAMITLESIPRFQDKRGSEAGNPIGQSPFSTKFIGRFRQRLPTSEIAFMQTYAGRDMTAYGYELEPILFSLRERLLFYIITWPINLTRIAAGRAVEAVRFRRRSGARRHTPRVKQSSLAAE